MNDTGSNNSILKSKQAGCHVIALTITPDDMSTARLFTLNDFRAFYITFENVIALFYKNYFRSLKAAQNQIEARSLKKKLIKME